jgi:hypothetical protein
MEDVVLDVGCEGCYFLIHVSIWELIAIFNILMPLFLF